MQVAPRYLFCFDFCRSFICRSDTYSLSVNNQSLDINKKDISWKSDRDHKFGKDVYPTNFQNGTLRGGEILNETKPLSEQEDLNVWMRTAALPTFRKLYGKIETDLQEGLCFFLAVAFTLIYLIKPRCLGDPSYLSWNRNLEKF
ncbi:hypothetical protein LIER_42836 [Lithospermum erythrorhizon]|uniref:Uncharacterized protein n=1 Tax=Lithospermum erythrorhizon TaxID=34254 RepID=A0AAV3P0J4_LITER